MYADVVHVTHIYVHIPQNAYVDVNVRKHNVRACSQMHVDIISKCAYVYVYIRNCKATHEHTRKYS